MGLSASWIGTIGVEMGECWGRTTDIGAWYYNIKVSWGQSVAFSISAPALFNLICFNFHPIERTEQHQSAGIDGVQWRLTRKTINQKWWSESKKGDSNDDYETGVTKVTREITNCQVSNVTTPIYYLIWTEKNPSGRDGSCGCGGGGAAELEKLIFGFDTSLCL